MQAIAPHVIRIRRGPILSASRPRSTAPTALAPDASPEIVPVSEAIFVPSGAMLWINSGRTGPIVRITRMPSTIISARVRKTSSRPASRCGLSLPVVPSGGVNSSCTIVETRIPAIRSSAPVTQKVGR